MSNQPPYGNPPGGGYPPPPGGGYPPPPGGGGGGYPPPPGGGGYPPPGGGGYPPPGGGGFPPPGGNYPPPDNKTKTFGMSYNVAAMLCYLPACLCCANLIFGIIWMATEPKENRFVRFHALQGLLLFGVHFVVVVILRILGAVLAVGSELTPGSSGGLAYLGGNGILGILGLLIGLVFLVIYIIGMIKANQGQMWKLPVIGDIAEKNS